ncbi:hypothetical protein SASPL_153107 [Salvia splendens]|uniref:PLD phosphodiesterase domain-containing protein n=2 Tax=Salvia splendens TaxID=180675 RepID=A0A8X8Z0P1_SALSN|nr:phospholipase D Z-like isoform X1 [Salvia splendens]XP_042038036.1 phospholipase D Z-like isoform X1 [Salvia splendens]KAG6387912.1 hypothetical protein SASPL_153107 [Salvia splendens]
MRAFAVALSVFLCVLIIYGPTLRVQSSLSDNTQCKVWLVQSIPSDMPHLAPVPGLLRTADVFRWMAGNSSRSLDIIAQYWQLIAHPDDPRSGDYGYSKDDMLRFGANEGYEVYRALDNAADRNISMRFLQHSGFYPDYTQEASALAAGRPNVENVTLLLKDWWGSGIVHAKVWISDSRDVYIGSANNDWKSLTQVKEVGVYLAGCPRIVKKVEIYFENLWKLAHLNSSLYTKLVTDQQWQTVRKVPCWSYFLEPKDRCRSPLPKYVKIEHTLGYPSLSDPDTFHISIETPATNNSASQHQPSYLSFAPPELLFDKYQSDEQAWIDTIKSVGDGETVRISTMDWLGQSAYMSQTVYWASLSSAISEVVYSKHATVKLLVAYWAHFIDNTDMYLKSLLYTNNLCSSSKYNSCHGKVEIKYFIVPGFNRTGPAKSSNGTATGNMYPGFTRVNHGKYAVSDVRGHIGTSNLVWDYFYADAGLSFGTYNLGIVSQLQQIFDADWDSPYAVPVEPLVSS